MPAAPFIGSAQVAPAAVAAPPATAPAPHPVGAPMAGPGEAAAPPEWDPTAQPIYHPAAEPGAQPATAWNPAATPGPPVWPVNPANAPLTRVHSAVDTASFTKVLLPLAIGAAVVVALGVYGKVHEPAGIAVNLAGFSGPLEAKVWLATGAFGLAIVQLVSALVMYGKVPGVKSPSWIGRLHRWSGRLAFLLAVPVAVHCLYAVGFQSYDARVLVHSIMGCFFFGAFTVKMLILPKRGVPGWVLPLFGGTVFTGLVILWLTSSFWFFTNVGVQF